MEKNEYDVIVVGAGPAGATVAFFTKLLDKSKKVLLIDRLDERKYNLYHRMCGEGVNSKIIKELDPLKIDGIIDKIRLTRTLFGNYKIEESADGIIVNRVTMLRSIIEQFQKLGGEYENSNFQKLEIEKNQIKVTINNETLYTNYLVGADGTHSKVRKSCDIPDPEYGSVVQYVIDKDPEKGVLEIYYDEKYDGGYKWIFPNGETTKIGFPSSCINNEKIDGEILQKQSRCIAYGGVDNFIKGNIILIGDAAGQSNPLTKGGIRPGMIAAKWAADAIIKNNPKLYEGKWLNSWFNSSLSMYALERFKKMDNSQIIDCYEPFVNCKSDLSYVLKSLYHIKYLKFHFATYIAELYGW